MPLRFSHYIRKLKLASKKVSRHFFSREEYTLNKDKNLNIRISTKDLDYIKHRSKKANLTITGYVTKCALNKKIYVYTYGYSKKWKFV